LDALAERQAVAAVLDGREIAFGAELARQALRKRYDEMRIEDWRRLAGHVLALGWKSSKIGKTQVWVRPI
jgi:hypothetical protein